MFKETLPQRRQKPDNEPDNEPELFLYSFRAFPGELKREEQPAANTYLGKLNKETPMKSWFPVLLYYDIKGEKPSGNKAFDLFAPHRASGY